MNTLTTILDRAGITVPDETIADIEIPAHTGPQRQGDVGIFPRPTIGAAELTDMTVIPTQGIPVVRGEATGNTHLLMPEPGCDIRWRPHDARNGDVLLGVLHVPDGAVAHLIHTDEHGANSIGPGTYRITGKREQADEIRRVAD